MNRKELERLYERWKNYPGRYTPTALDMTELLGALLGEHEDTILGGCLNCGSSGFSNAGAPDHCPGCAAHRARTNALENWSA